MVRKANVLVLKDMSISDFIEYRSICHPATETGQKDCKNASVLVSFCFLCCCFWGFYLWYNLVT